MVGAKKADREKRKEDWRGGGGCRGGSFISKLRGKSVPILSGVKIKNNRGTTK